MHAHNTQCKMSMKVQGETAVLDEALACQDPEQLFKLQLNLGRGALQLLQHGATQASTASSAPAQRVLRDLCVARTVALSKLATGHLRREQALKTAATALSIHDTLLAATSPSGLGSLLAVHGAVLHETTAQWSDQDPKSYQMATKSLQVRSNLTFSCPCCSKSNGNAAPVIARHKSAARPSCTQQWNPL